MTATARHLRTRPELTSDSVSRGKSARAAAPRTSHAEFQPGPRRSDPVELLGRQGRTRVTELIPIRYGRMLASPFTFYRGAAAIMAEDLAATPQSGLLVQCCGDAHLSNFGVFASPERRLVFDLNDFDETLPGPWEWDVKRLAVSMLIAAAEQRVLAERISAERCSSASSDLPARDGASSRGWATSTSGTRASTSRRCSPSTRDAVQRRGR